MIDFMVISGERSGSTWVANWLTTDTTMCIHDPLLRYTRDGLDYMHFGMKRVGIACTALQMYPGWVNAHPARKVIVHRDDKDIAESWDKLGVGADMSAGTNERLWAIKGFHCRHEDLFNQHNAVTIASMLGVSFDFARHAELVQMNIQVQWAAQRITKRPVEQLVDRIRKTLEQP